MRLNPGCEPSTEVGGFYLRFFPIRINPIILAKAGYHYIPFKSMAVHGFRSHLIQLPLAARAVVLEFETFLASVDGALAKIKDILRAADF